MKGVLVQRGFPAEKKGNNTSIVDLSKRIGEHLYSCGKKNRNEEEIISFYPFQ